MLGCTTGLVRRHGNMGRRRRRSYVNRRVKQPVSPVSAVRPTSANKPTTIGVVHKLRSHMWTNESSIRLRTEQKAHILRSFLQRIVKFNTMCVTVEVILGYYLIHDYQEMKLEPRKYVIQTVISVLTLLQVGLIVCYWKAFTQYSEAVRSALSPGNVIHKGLKRTPTMLGFCVSEVTFYLISLYSSLLLPFETSSVEPTSGDLTYILLLFRSYQAVRLLYWYCPFSNVRSHIFARVTMVEHTQGFVMRCCLASYGFVLLAGVGVVMLVIPGVVEYVLERHNPVLGMDVIWNDLWVVSYTLTNIGYGNMTPLTFLGQFFILAAAIFGSLILGFMTTVSNNSLGLSLRECDLYSHLLYTREKRKYETIATVTIQRWWRLMKMRLSKSLHVPTILLYYTQLSDYRNTLVACRAVKDTLFKRQIDGFDHTTHKVFHTLNEYLSPIVAVHPLLQDIYRGEYRIKYLCHSLLKSTQRIHSSAESLHHDHTATTYQTSSDISVKTGIKTHIRAKAKLNAYQNLKGRLVKEDAWECLEQVGEENSGEIPQVMLSHPCN